MQTKLLLIVNIVLASAALFDPEEELDSVGLIEYFGYPAETHVAETEDGFLLDVHRIPYGKNDSSAADRPVVIFQHGFGVASDSWLVNLPNESAPFVFADAGFDVWIGNSRGNKYTNHKEYTRANPGFWKFTYDQMAQYDLPALFDLVENVTGQSSVYYVGHSQGCFMMFARLSFDPTFHQRVKKFFALGPGPQMKHVGGPFKVLCSTDAVPVLHEVWNAAAYTEMGLGLTDPRIIGFLTDATCRLQLEKEYCQTVEYVIVGESTTENVTRIPVYFKHFPAGTSTAALQHLCQTSNFGGFNYYQYPTSEENLEAYGQLTPPAYDVSKINAPIYLYSSPADIVTTTIDLDEFLLPRINKSVVIQDNRITGFSHMDFQWSLNATDLVYKPIIKTILEDF